MKRKKLFIGVIFLILFTLWTILIRSVDVKPIGPNNSSVGFSTINLFINKLTGINMIIYNITDWLGIIPFLIFLFFALVGLIQWIERKSILKVDYSLLILGIFYLIVLLIFFFFEKITINYRPILINGNLEASYPSSTTMLVTCVIPTAVSQLRYYIKNKNFRITLSIILYSFAVFMVVARLISGVHWFTDIIGGILISIGLVFIYIAFIKESQLQQ